MQLFQVPQMNAMKILSKVGTKDQLLSVPHEESPPGLPPKSSVDNVIEFERDAKPPHHPLYQMASAELEAAKSYVQDLLRKGNFVQINPRKALRYPLLRKTTSH